MAVAKAHVCCAVKSYTQHINEGLVHMLPLSSHSLFLSLVSMATGGHLLHWCFRLTWSQTLVIVITPPLLRDIPNLPTLVTHAHTSTIPYNVSKTFVRCTFIRTQSVDHVFQCARLSFFCNVAAS